jgi:glycine dehydrogenase
MLSFVGSALPRTARPAVRVVSRTGLRSFRLSAIRSLATPSSTQHAPVLGSTSVSQSLFAPLDAFASRHLGPRSSDVDEMLQSLGYDSIEKFVDDTIPSSIRLRDLNEVEERLPRLSESELSRRGNEIADMNVVKKSLIGMGYYNTNVPPVIQRNVNILMRRISGRRHKTD